MLKLRSLNKLLIWKLLQTWFAHCFSYFVGEAFDAFTCLNVFIAWSGYFVLCEEILWFRFSFLFDVVDFHFDAADAFIMAFHAVVVVRWLPNFVIVLEEFSTVADIDVWAICFIIFGLFFDLSRFENFIILVLSCFSLQLSSNRTYRHFTMILTKPSFHH